ncbi:MAG: histidine--tRNA ligase [Gemmatimonadaceae bacterium]
MSKGALPGFRDFYPDDFAKRAHILQVWRDVARRFAFVEYDGPPLEPLELFTRKSGEEIVGQLYNFTDKGDRQVALRPEMTPTFARMVAAKANTLRKPVRWFSVPQLFRYERQQKGRLREHFQLNVDIVGETSVSADAELLAVALEIMRAFGLTPEDVVARVSDRRLLAALLSEVGVDERHSAAVFAVIDKVDRQPRQVSREALTSLGLRPEQAEEVFALFEMHTPGAVRERYGRSTAVAPRLDDLERYFEYLAHLDVAQWARLDLSVVRGLAYYTGIVFELFDAQGEFRAICGGGRYDDLLQSLGNVDLPALGFGMGDVVLGELLKARGLSTGSLAQPDFWVATEAQEALGDVMTAATLLRRVGASVEYALRPQTLSKQRKAAFSAGAAYFLVLAADFQTSGRFELQTLGSRDGRGSPSLEELAAAAAGTVDSLAEVVGRNRHVLRSAD